MLSTVVIIFCLAAEFFGREAARRFLSYSYSYNTGAAFGLLSDAPAMLLNLEIAANVIVLLLLVFARMKKWTRIGLSMMFGGALSNLLERFLLGHVIDWLPVPYTSLQFNLSDVFIGLGALLVFTALTDRL